jgi:hypothetical protein
VLGSMQSQHSMQQSRPAFQHTAATQNTVSTAATHPFADALDLQAAAACSHGPVCHQRVGLVQPHNVVPRVEAWVKVSKACRQGQPNSVIGQGRTGAAASQPGRCCCLLHSPQEPLSMATL